MSQNTQNFADPIIVRADVEVQSDGTEAFLAALREFIAEVLATEPCDSFEIFSDEEVGTKFFLVEKWRSKAYYLSRHQSAPHLQKLYAAVGPLLAGPPQFTFWDAH